jgi:D-alanine-D-alanine ligase-like ATP-grasp enzyme
MPASGGRSRSTVSCRPAGSSSLWYGAGVPLDRGFVDYMRSERPPSYFAPDPGLLRGSLRMRPRGSTLANAVLRGHRLSRTAYAHFDVLRCAGVVHGATIFHDQRQDAKSNQTVRHEIYQYIWGDAVRALGGEVLDLGGGLLELHAEGAATRVWQQETALDDPVSLRLAGRKPLVHRLLAAEGLPVPESLAFNCGDIRAAQEFLRQSDSGCVIKPAADTGAGDGVTCGVTAADELARACVRASRRGDELLIERQVQGDVYRLLFLDGQLLGTVRQGRPRVIGDGSSSIGQLIAAENGRRAEARGFAGLSRLKVDLDCFFTLRRYGLQLQSVPAVGESVAVKTASNQCSVEDRHTCTTVSSGIVTEASRAARATGLRLAGVDVITRDPTMSLADSGGVINEVNGTPGLHHHYLVSDPAEAPRVARPVLRRILFP